MIKTQIRLNITKEVKRRIDAANKELNKIGVEHVADLKRNIDRGQGFNGQPLKEYSRSYQYQRSLEGRRISPPDLRRTGIMLNALTTTTTTSSRASKMQIFFIPLKAPNQPSAEEKARLLQELGFKFFGVSRQTRQQWIRRLTRIIKDDRRS